MFASLSIAATNHRLYLSLFRLYGCAALQLKLQMEKVKKFKFKFK